MAKKKILIVDSDIKSQRILEVSLRKEGYAVTTAQNGVDAMEKIAADLPDLIISDTKMPEMDGFEFCSRLKADKSTAQIPFIFLTWQKTLQDKVRGLEMGVEDYLTKPIYVKEILTRVKLLLEKRDKERIGRKEGKAQFSGDLSDMALVDLIQTVELGHKSGTISIESNGIQGKLYFKDGKVIDAELGKYTGERAVYRMLMLSEGTFSLVFKDVDMSERIGLSSQALLMEGMRRMDEWERLCSELPPLDEVFDQDKERVEQSRDILPPEVREVLDMVDGQRSLGQIIDDSDLDEISTLNILARLYFEAFIRSTGEKAERPRSEPAEKHPDSEKEALDQAAGPSQAGQDEAKDETIEKVNSGDETVTDKQREETTERETAPADQGEGEKVSDDEAGQVLKQPEGPMAENEGESGSEDKENKTETEKKTVELPRPAAAPAAAAGEEHGGSGKILWLLGAALVASLLYFGVLKQQGRVDVNIGTPVDTGDNQPVVEAGKVVVGGPQKMEEAQPDTTGGAGTGGQVLTSVKSEQGTETGITPSTDTVGRREGASEETDTGGNAGEPGDAGHGAPKAEPGKAVPLVAVPSIVAEAAKKRPLDIYREHLKQGKRLWDQGKSYEAIKEYKKALEVFPRGVAAYRALGNLYNELDKNEKAIYYLKKGLRISPKDPSLYLTLGAVYQTLGRNRQARRAYENYLALNPRGKYADDVRAILKDLD